MTANCWFKYANKNSNNSSNATEKRPQQLQLFENFSKVKKLQWNAQNQHTMPSNPPTDQKTYTDK